MLFLLNDRVLSFQPAAYLPPVDAARFDSVSMPYVLQLGQEVFAERPLLHREDEERAKRLAVLIASKAPEVNAALFVAPSAGCRPEQVITRLVSLDVGLMSRLLQEDRRGALTCVSADNEVWRRLAA